MFAIQNTKTKKFVYGTDFRYNPVHQRCSFNKVLIFDSRESAEAAMHLRKCGKNYCVVKVKLIDVKEGDPDA